MYGNTHTKKNQADASYVCLEKGTAWFRLRVDCVYSTGILYIGCKQTHKKLQKVSDK